MAIQIPFVKYTFRIPPIPTMKEFELYKKSLDTKPDLSIEPSYKSFLKLPGTQIKVFIIMTAILLFIILLNLLAIAISSKPGSPLELIMAFILVIYFLGYVGLLISKFFSFNSFSDFKWESKKYYTHLKKLIVESYTYDLFVINYRNTYKTEK